MGMLVKAGRYGGTYAHKDIAFHFAMWLSPEFQIYLINEFQRLKASENDKVLLVVYNPVKKKAVMIVGGNTRIGGTQSVTLPSSFTGDEVQCYISFGTPAQSVVSNSEFAGGIIVS